MKQYTVEGTDQNPSINLNFEKGEFYFYGKSYPENVSLIYDKSLELISEYSKHPKEITTLNFEWLYFNTATYNILVHIINELEKIDSKLVINWICKKDFKVMIEKGKFLSNVIDTPVNILDSY